MKLFKNSIKNNNKGQAIVELALLLPLLLFVIIVMIDFGRVLNAFLVVNNASREGARQAVVGKSDTVITQTINDATTSLDSSSLGINISPSITNRTRGTAVEVTVSYSVDIITPMIDVILPNPYTVVSTTTMRVE